nr:hypothetical protein HK105_003131 [Polyrhizophydium stewartii]
MAEQQSRTFYDVLGVKPSAKDEEIRQGYIRESLKYHPDRNPAEDATQRFQEIANAYYALSDKQRRAEYDASLKDAGVYPAESVNPFTIFGQVFDELLIPEVPNPTYFWQPVGSAAGALLGFIVLNIPGAVIGGYYGNRMGKIRDMKGRSVYEAFAQLSSERRKEILSALGKKFFTSAITN